MDGAGEGTEGSGRPSGVVTLLFTDIEGSTRLWETFPAQMQAALATHDRILRRANEAAGGYVFKTVGDAFCVAFSDAASGVLAAVEAQRSLLAEAWPAPIEVRVRMALHTGPCVERDGDYFGPTVNRAARLEAAAHGGQLVVSAATRTALVGSDLGDVRLIDLGEHRLKDLDEPEHVFLVEAAGLPDAFGPVRSAGTGRVGHLPEMLGAFVGREAEVDALTATIATSRITTLIGPGGVGKTRLATEAASRMAAQFVDGAWMAELGPLPAGATTETIAGSMAVDLGLRLASADGLVEALSTLLAGQRRLVVVDNCEHLVDAAARFVSTLARHCPDVVFLATSRAPLSIAGESVIVIEPLAVPEAGSEDLAGSSSVRLFVDRAGRSGRGWTLAPEEVPAVAEICRRLDGMPLAIELAAAQVRVMPVGKIAERLHDRFTAAGGGRRDAGASQRTLRATIDWSYQLLTGDQRRALRLLSMFDGRFDLGSVEQMLAGATADDPLGLLLDLVDNSLVATTSDGYRMLETIAQFAREQLEAEGERDEGWARLVGWAEATVPPDSFELSAEQLTRVGFHYDTFRALFAWGGADRVDVAAIASRLYRYWLWSTRCAEGVDVLERCLPAVADDDLAPEIMARLGGLMGASGDFESADRYNRRSEAAARERGLHGLLVRVAYNRSCDLYQAGKLIDSAAAADEAVSLLHHFPPDSPWHSGVRATAIMPALQQGRFDRVRQLLDEQAAALAHVDDPVERLKHTWCEALLALAEERIDVAIAGFREVEVAGQGEHEDFDLVRLEVWPCLVKALCAAGDVAGARAVADDLRAALRDHENGEVIATGHHALGILGLAEGDDAAALADFGAALRGAQQAFQVAYPAILEGAAVAFERTGRPERATAVAHAAAELRTETGAPLLALDARLLDGQVATLVARPCAAPLASTEAAVTAVLSG